MHLILGFVMDKFVTSRIAGGGLALLAVVLFLAGNAAGQTGVWKAPVSGDYNVGSNWQSGVAPSGAGATADFSTLNITSDVQVTLDTPLTIGHLKFGDTNTSPGSGGSWEVRTGLSPIPVITLDAGGTKPTITVNPLVPATTFDDAFIGHSLAGANGFTKLGGGILSLGGGTTNTITGGVNVDAGTLRLLATLPAQTYTLANGTTLNTIAFGGGNFDPTTNAVTIAPGATATVYMQSAGTMIPISGAGSTLNFVMGDSGLHEMRGNWAAAGELAQLNVSTDPIAGGAGTFRFDINRNPNGFSGNLGNTRVHLDNATVVTRTNSFGNTVAIGELTGTATGRLSGGAAGSAARYEIGNLNTNSTFSGVIVGAGGLSINKVGTGTLTLAGTFDGSPALTGQSLARQGGVIRVSSGTLAITGATSIPGGSGTTLTTIDVLPGATFNVSGAPGTFATSELQKLQGGGAVVGNYNHAAGQIRPGDVASTTAANEGNLSSGIVSTAGTLTFNGNLQLSGGEIVYDLSPTPASGNDLILVNGTTTLTSGVITPNFLGAAPTTGTYTVLTSSGGFVGSPTNIAVNFPGRGTDPQLQISGNSLVFNAADIVPGATLVWTGAANSNWDIQASQNWNNNGSPDVYFNRDFVTFNDTAANKSVTITENVEPSSITITTNAGYSFTGTGAIIGDTGLTKTGSGNLTIQTPNAFTGPASIQGGTVDIGTFGGALGQGQLTLSGVTVLGQGGGLTNSGVESTPSTTNVFQIDGTTGSGGTFNVPTMTGAGTMTITSTLGDKWFALNGTSGFSGTLNLTGLVGQTNNTYRLTTTSGGTTLPNAVVNLTAATLANRQGAAAGTVLTFEFGELHGDAQSVLNAFIGGSTAVAANWQIGALNTNSDFAGTIIDGAGSGGSTSASHVTKVGSGSLTLSGANTYSGNTTVEGGTLSITNPFLSDTGDVLLSAGTTINLDFAGTDTIDSLFFDGISQEIGTWGAVGSGAMFTTPLITGTGILQVTTKEATAIPGDFDGNGFVDGADLTVWRNNFGTGVNADADNDGDSDGADFLTWQRNFGQGTPPASPAAAAVPEPTTLLIAVCGLAIAASASRGARRRIEG